ncbi:hypothetical protein MATR_09010 [Marivirga tractuosa]|uniref:Lipoprotein n=1 Tax=Marivirga tractuosa (strain ATCC 23168 / DSM 4126 / NBRC 15989 / NCIMB 1408 / VKM B-1430 / H-43) TaxID=643867 RepID=E4TNN3_MARTH|nr:hypothetical protein [Marivirga tractuosa]ADR21470.1 hypothetical protein Ftrac_1480 [Marivirga tractuosa DSM 4126]BDD14076.1 hypothetical protein MATR_09010 [Marivirga tractuosa]
MKLKLLSLIICSFLIISCKEDMDSKVESDVIKVTLKGTELFEYKFSDSHPIEGAYNIRKQAQHFQISEIQWATYNYQAKEGFEGFETVEIVLTGSPGDDNFTDYQKWVFEIEVK